LYQCVTVSIQCQAKDLLRQKGAEQVAKSDLSRLTHTEKAVKTQLYL